MYYQLSPKGRKFTETREDGPRAAIPVLDALATQTAPAAPLQIARALNKSEADINKALTYLAGQGFVTEVKIRPRPTGPHFKTIEELAEQELKEQRAKQKWAHSEKGQKSRRKYELGKGKLAKQKYQQSPKGKAAYERWRRKIKLTPKGLAKLQEEEWTPEHDLLAYIHLEKPTKQQLTEEQFELLRKEAYI